MLALVGLASAAVVMVDCSRLRPGIDVAVLYRHVGSLAEGADVELAGRTIGVVKSITLLPPSAVRDPSHPLHPDGGVSVHLRLQKRYAGWTALNSEIVITTKGIVGEPYLEIGPPAGGAARERPLREGDRVRGVDPARMDQVLLHGYLNMTAFRALLDDIAPSARDLRDQLGQLGDTLRAIEPSPGAYSRLGDSLGQLADQFDEMRTRWRAGDVDPGEIVRLAGAARALFDRAGGELGRTGEGIDRLAADIRRIRGRIPADLGDRLQVAVANARAAVTRLQHITQVAKELAQRVERGRGTIGALLHDPEFIDDAKKLGKIIKRQPWKVLGHPTHEALEHQPQD